MIYVFGKLKVPVKQLYDNAVMQVELEQVSDLLPLDPEVSTVELLVFYDVDVPLLKRKSFAHKLNNRHPDLTVVIFSQKLASSPFASVEDIYLILLPKIDKDIIKETLDPLLQNISKQYKLNFSENLKEDNEINNIFDSSPLESPPIEPPLNIEFTPPTPPLLVSSSSSSSSSSSPSSSSDLINTFEEVKEKAIDTIISQGRINPDILTKVLNSDSIANKLLRENNTFHGAITMLDVLDAEITNIFKNSSLSPTEKFLKIKDLGVKRSSHVDVKNNLISESMLSIINQVVSLMSTLAEERIDEVTKAVNKIVDSETFIFDEEKIRADIENRLDCSIKIQDTLNDLVTSFNIINKETAEFIKSQADGLPSSNAFINEMLSHTKHVFLPANMDIVINKIMDNVKSSAETFELIESNLKRLLANVFEYVNATENHLTRQTQLVSLLKHNKVENIIIPDSILKSSLRAFVGIENSGRTATLILHSEMQARTRNTLVVSFTKNHKFQDYGISVFDIEDYFEERTYKQILYLQAIKKNNMEYVKECIKKLIPSLSNYNNINLLFDVSQWDLISAVAKDLLSVTFITNTMKNNLITLSEITSKFNFPNVAQRLVIIDPPKYLPSILDLLKIDITITNLILIPHLSSIREYAIKGLNPGSDPDLLRIFTEVF